MSRDDAVLLDILKAARMASGFVTSEQRAEFMTDAKTQSAVLHQLLVLGEAVKRLSDDFRMRNPEIPWKQLAGMRDRLIHHYDDVDVDEVWNTITSDLPKLIDRMLSLVQPSAD